MGYNYADPQAEAYHKSNPEHAGAGNRERERRRHARHLRHRSRQRLRRFLRSLHHHRTRLRRGLVAVLSARGRGSRAASCGPASTTAASHRRISGRTSVRNTASSTLAAFPRTPSSTTSRGGPSKPVLHLFPHWNWPGLEGQEIAVWVHSNLDRVELFHNGQSLGAKDVKKDQHLAWNREVRAGHDRGARLQGRQAGDDRKARDHRTGGEAGAAAGSPRDLGRRRRRRDVRGAKFRTRRDASCRSPTTRSRSR